MIRPTTCSEGEQRARCKDPDPDAAEEEKIHCLANAQRPVRFKAQHVVL